MKLLSSTLLAAALVGAATANSSTSLRRKLPSGASNAASNQVPAFVELKSSTGRICGGILVKPDIVATAAACTYSQDGSSQADSTSQAFVKGSVTSSEAGISRNWLTYVVHPDYSYGSETNNVAVIQLSSPVDTVAVMDVNLWTEVTVGTSVLSAGYGTGDTAEGEDALLLASLMVLEEGAAGCVTGNTDQVICANSDTQDMCVGDEGAPLLDGENLVGIYSHGGSCDGATGSPKFMRAPYFRDFITSQACTLNPDNCSVVQRSCNSLRSALSGMSAFFGF